MTVPLRTVQVLAVLGLLWVASGWGGGDPSPSLRWGPVDSTASEVWVDDATRQRVDLELVREALAPISETYVEPERIDPERMLRMALRRVERRIPEALILREHDRVFVQAGTHRVHLPIPRLSTVDELQRALEQVAYHVVEPLRERDFGLSEPLPWVVEMAMAEGILSTLDPHSAVLGPEDSHKMNVENRGEFGGLGIQISLQDDQLTIDAVVAGQPAALAGLRVGDRLLRIDGQATINLSPDETVGLLRGPVGSTVTLEVGRDGLERPMEVQVQRASIKILEVEAWAMPGGVAYVKLPSFHSTAASDLQAQLRRIARQEGGLRGVILDLRNNPGGYLNQAVDIADLFLSSGEIVATRARRGVRPRPEMARGPGTLDEVPMAVLVNAWSASASEIVAGALKSHDRAVIIGERTFGKGSVQNLQALPRDASLKLTIAHYLTPGGRSIQSLGVPVDIEMVPTLLESADGEAHLRFFSRQWVRRELDLDEHLDAEEGSSDRPSWRLRWWSDGLLSGQGAEPDATRDAELALALDLIHAARSPRRPEMLMGAGSVIARWRAEQDERHREVIESMGLDWSSGPAPDPTEGVRVEVAADVEGGGLVAGASRDVRLRVTNRGSEPLYRVVVVAEGHGVLEGTEFPIGRIAPGEQASWTRTITVDPAYPTEQRPVRWSVHDASHAEIAHAEQTLSVAGRERPRLAWTWSVAPVAGEAPADRFALEVALRNVGEGPALGATARVRNRSGRALELRQGTLRGGTWRVGGHAEGERCQPADAAVAASSGCQLVLAPGETWTGVIELEVREPRDEDYAIDLVVQEDAVYDWATSVRSGFAEWHGHEERITFGPSGRAAAPSWREPPHIELSREPHRVSIRESAVVSGLVSDDRSVDWVAVFVDGDKVGLEDVAAGDPVSSVPFTADVPLSPGLNTISVIASDQEGWVSSVSRVVWKEDPGWRAQAVPGPSTPRVAPSARPEAQRGR